MCISKSLKTKLSSRSGASILIALLLFLVAAMVSAVIISAAITALKSVHSSIENEQDYLNVSSAARLVGQGLSDTQCNVEITTKTINGVPQDAIPNKYKGSGTFGDLIEEAMESEMTAEYTWSIDLDGISGDEKEALKTCEFTFKIEGTDIEDPENSYKIEGNVLSPGGKQKVHITAWAVDKNDGSANGSSTNLDGVTTYKEYHDYKWEIVKIDSTGGSR